MQLSVGTSYTFDSNAVTIQGGQRMLFNKGNQPYANLLSIRVKGYLSGDGQAALIQAESALRTALQAQYPEVVFLADDSTESPLSLRNTGSITGVRITDGPHFNDTRGPEYATLRTFEFQAEAEYPFVDSGTLYLDFTESLFFEGGGPVFIFRRALNTVPQRQMTWPATEYRVVQSGSASGYLAFPSPPPSKWPFALAKAPQVRKVDPDRKGPAGWEGFKITWEYTHESVTPLAGVPTLWAF